MSEPTSAGGPADRRAGGAVAALARYLEAGGWAPRRLPGDAFAVVYAGASGAFDCFALIRGEAEQLICYAVAPFRASPERRPAVAEFVTRANFGLFHGNLELDYADGELRARCSLDFEGERLTAGLVRNTLLPAARLLDAYLPGLRRVALDGADPAAAVAAVEEA